jgi:Ca2+-binding RTX toxin-like protein
MHLFLQRKIRINLSFQKDSESGVARVKQYDGFNDSKSNVFDLDSFSLRQYSDYEMIYADKRGAAVDISGKNFTFSNGEVTGGTITSAVITDKNGDVIYTAKDVDLSAKTFSHYYDRDGAWATDYVFILGNDKITGTNSNDALQGDLGNDILYGKGGDDFIYSAWGDDTVYGGGGDDYFEFDAKKSSSLTLADFEDHGSHQDLIAISKKFYNHMETYQRHDNVVMTFEDHKITIEDYDKHDLGRDDFNLL